MTHTFNLVKIVGIAVPCLLLLTLWTEVGQAAPSPLSIKSAVYNKKTASLIVKTHTKDPGGLLTLIHSKGGVLGQSQENEHTFTIPLAELGEVPCQVEARLGELKISKAVAGAGAECSKVPVCKILKPVSNLKTTINQPTHFEAQYTLKDKKAGPLAIEWDFAGGVMGHPYQKPLKGNKPIISGKHKTDATFVRDNSRYHVRFMANDTQGRHCESSVYVDVGTPPTDLPDAAALDAMVQASQTNAPAKGSALKIPAGEKVVLPYQDWTMQTATDARTVPNVYVVYGPQVNNINATVYEKARKPVVVGADKIKLKYSASTNPADPVGPNSINSTSQNYPVGNSLMDASVQKSDYFETAVLPEGAVVDPSYYSYSFAGFLTPDLASAVDEGYHSARLTPPLNPDHGSYMPGKTGPYVDNIPQTFSDYVEANNLFAARMLPVTDIDDSGRVNPTPLFRVEASESGNDTSIAATDIVVSSGRDFHCRECHAKGKIGANPNRPQIIDPMGMNMTLRDLNFVEPDSDSLFDQEYAAIKNIANLHLYGHTHEGAAVFRWMEKGIDADGNVSGGNGPLGCDSGGCHITALSRTPYQQPLYGINEFRDGLPLSDDIHNMHGQMQYNATKDDIVRRDVGYIGYLKRFDPEANWDPVTGSMPNSLFPVKDANGKILPMEENCLKCHGGQREQCYRDRMYTAGVTCYQCHGDMLAVGNSFKKSIPSADGNTYRQPWLDEPDCGSCHTGNANQGKAATGGFFSAGIMRTAFDETDRSATPRQPDLFNPDQSRFAVPVTPMDIGDLQYTVETGLQPITTKTRLYRAAKDNHGQVACAACHGAAHAIWPNRDPNANDNVTSLQLQGHIGHIAECSVCHTADAFAKFEDLDEGLKATDPQTGILGGPHNMHPVNDPNWWKQADGDLIDSTPDSPKRKDGVIKGGWHNDYAKLPGKAGEDQCAACHGNDHLGTRLSKTPVDREFINEKGKTIMVKAGTMIGCNLCHSVIKSCTKSPGLNNCGKASEHVSGTTNLPPKILSQPPTLAIIGEEYRYAIQASDPKGGELSYQLTRPQPDELNIDSHTGVITATADAVSQRISSYGIVPPAVLFDYKLLVSDNQGSQSLQAVTVTVDCPAGQLWDAESSVCVDVLITSQSPVVGLNADQPYSYQVTAKQRSGQPLSYSLSDQPAGMNIVANTGLITWDKAQGNAQGYVYFTLTVSNNTGGSAQQQIFLSVCSAPLHWEQDLGGCVGPVNITSYSEIQHINTGEIYSYPVTASQVNNLPLIFGLTNAPATMTIDSNTGLINWLVKATTSGVVEFSVTASDGQGGTAQQYVSVMVCAAPEQFDSNTGGCTGPITFTSSPTFGVDAGQPYSYQVTATHANGLSLTYSLGDIPNLGIPKPDGLSINSITGDISWVAQVQPIETAGYASFSVIATDSNGYSTLQTLQIRVCESGSNWNEAMGVCRGAVRITSTAPVSGFDVGQVFTYQVTATEANAAGLPITYSLSDLYPQSLDMSINPNTGLITWVVAVDPNYQGSPIGFTVTASDTLGQQEQQTVYLPAPCVSPQHWSTENGGCQ